MWSTYLTEVSGKWILTGEHAVLRGFAAIALPHPEYRMSFSFQPQVWNEIRVAPLKMREAVMQAVDEMLSWTGEKFKLPFRPCDLPRPQGGIQIESNIPLSGGFGSSAALCVVLVRWLVHAYQGDGTELAEDQRVSSRQIIDMARELENRFHGKSSGLDGAVVHLGVPVSYAISRGAINLGVKLLPRFSFHDTGERSSTKECVEVVEKKFQTDPIHAERWDERMGSATRAAMDGLVMYARGGRKPALARIASGMTLAHQCFEYWDLVTPRITDQVAELKKQGALAVKLTGAGRGGFLVALWDDPVVGLPTEDEVETIPEFDEKGTLR